MDCLKPFDSLFSLEAIILKFLNLLKSQNKCLTKQCQAMSSKSGYSSSVKCSSSAVMLASRTISDVFFQALPSMLDSIKHHQAIHEFC